MDPNFGIFWNYVLAVIVLLAAGEIAWELQKDFRMRQLLAAQLGQPVARYDWTSGCVLLGAFVVAIALWKYMPPVVQLLGWV